MGFGFLIGFYWIRFEKAVFARLVFTTRVRIYIGSSAEPEVLCSSPLRTFGINPLGHVWEALFPTKNIFISIL